MARASEMLTVRSGDVKLAVYVSGPRRAPPLILVHGYPDSAAVWAPIRARLAQRYRVIAYDVRGAGASDAPRRRADYALARLADDLQAVADATCGGRPFHLVGHDWGSIQCWEAVTDPAWRGRIASYTSISGPCLDHVFRARMRLKQSLKSWYIAFFHLPIVPSLVWRLGGAALWPRWLQLTERVRVERDPSQLKNALNGLQMYRANFIARARKPRERHAQAPVQILVPVRDRYVTPEMTVDLDRWLGEHVREEIDGAHWIVLRNPDLIASRIDRFASAQERKAAPSHAAAAQPGSGRRLNSVS
ncbi:alpha/beta fold hydrolase [Burkholderia pseudomultivorans]|uniref:Alpha/beta hydrolase n=1 Tax=Burkholderia pseudomultivorans TaxID=1207504 RepID=A0A132EN13_9BURK|nr:alpha/beta fold hydrolase [Burkholderia pseudomultivorans]KWF37710.1 alpha/beta hydrolase [Burkholderia pseudomultivorans]